MSASARFAFYLDLISNAGKKSEQEARLVEQAQRRMADATDRTDHSVVKTGALAAGPQSQYFD